MTRQASRTAQSADEQIVRNVLASMTKQCDARRVDSVLGWEVAALHLALRRDYDRSDISWHSTRANGDTLYRVRSDSQPGYTYLVTVHPIAHPTCTCMAGARQQPCKHAGLALGVWAAANERARREAAGQGEWDHLTRAEHRDYCELMAAHFDGIEG